MIDLIKASVGRNAKNDKTDVYIVQEVLNLYALSVDAISKVTVDGISGAATEKAIYAFQKSVAKLQLPDSKIDNGGKTERIMAENADAAKLTQIVKKYRPDASQPLPSFPTTIRYGSNVLPEVSQYSESIIKLAMKFARVSTVLISSSRRTISDQARIMYDNCSRYQVSNVAALKQVRGWGYGPAGMAVEEVYFANKSKPQAEVRKAMEEKITELLQQGKRTSLHCVDKATYSSLNVIDIPYSSVDGGKKQAFQNALFSMANKIKNAVYTETRQYDYIDLIIVEDRCWHLEIPQDGKQLPG